MVAGELFEFVAAESPESTVADVKDMGGAGLQDKGGECGDAPFLGRGVSLSL